MAIDFSYQDLFKLREETGKGFYQLKKEYRRDKLNFELITAKYNSDVNTLFDIVDVLIKEVYNEYD